MGGGISHVTAPKGRSVKIKIADIYDMEGYIPNISRRSKTVLKISLLHSIKRI